MLNRLRGASLAVIVLLEFVSLAGCAQPLAKVVLRVAGQELSVEVARSDAEREHGLMGRKSLGEKDGMLFVFDRDEHLEFWMKNTPLPLSIAFISSEGKILEIRDMQPFDERTTRSRNYARYALEMNQGAFRRLGISEGDQIELPADFSR